MKISLTQALVLTKLNIDVIPEVDSQGRVSYKPNTKGEKYYVFDDSKNSPTGFGVLIGKKEKNYFVQKRVDGKLIRVSLGHVREFNSIEQARQMASEVGFGIKASKQHPKEIKEIEDLSEITLEQAFERYLKMLKSRATPIKPNTEKAINKAKIKLKDWMGRRVRDIGSQEILDRFDDIALVARTTAEQTFRWVVAAVYYIIKLEANDAAAQKRSPSITHNPFIILALNSKFRTKRELETHYDVNNTRNPMSYDTLGKWFEAILKKRSENRTGCDYLLLTTLWGTRYQEITSLKWRTEISNDEAKVCSWVDLKERKVFIFDTKNRDNHILPISDGAFEILQQRRELVLDKYPLDLRISQFVFPARSKFSKTGHYSDADSLKKYVMLEAGIDKLGIHDLRRTFGQIVEDSGIPYSAVKRLLNHRDLADTTQKYTATQYERLVEYMQKVECQMIKTCPKLWNMIMVPKHQPMKED